MGYGLGHSAAGSNPPAAGIIAVGLVMACIGVWVMASAGCKGSTKGYRTKVVSGGAPATCRVIVYSPLGDTGSPTENVEIKWDSRIVFSGPLPSGDDAMSGMPATLLEIQTNSGTHVLEVKHGAECMKVDVLLREGGRQCFMLFGELNGKKVLVEDLGSNPRFI